MLSRPGSGITADAETPAESRRNSGYSAAPTLKAACAAAPAVAAHVLVGYRILAERVDELRLFEPGAAGFAEAQLRVFNALERCQKQDDL